MLLDGAIEVKTIQYVLWANYRPGSCYIRTVAFKF